MGLLIPTTPLAFLDLANSGPIGDAAGSHSLDTQEGFLRRSYRRQFRITTTDPRVGQGVVLSVLQSQWGVALGSIYSHGATLDAFHEEDPQAFCVSLEPRQGADGCEWIVEAAYDYLTPRQCELISNPLTARPEIKVQYQPWEEVVDREIPVSGDSIYPDGAPILNSALDPFDPTPTRDQHRPIILYTANFASFNLRMMDNYRDHVNATTWHGIQPRCAKMAAPDVEECFSPVLVTDENPNGLYFRISYAFHLKADTWDRKILDAGYNQWQGSTTNKVPITLDDGYSRPPLPVPLDGTGHKQTVTTGGHINAVRQTLKIYPEAEFNDLGLVLPEEWPYSS